MSRLLFALLRSFRIGERRCAWCGAFLGLKRERPTSHGICGGCQMVHFPEAVA